MKSLRRSVALLMVLATLGGCAAGSLRRDLRDVSAATGATFSREVTDERAVSEETERSVRGLVAGGLSADTALRVAMLNNRALRAQLRERPDLRRGHVHDGHSVRGGRDPLRRHVRQPQHQRGPW